LIEIETNEKARFLKIYGGNSGAIFLIRSSSIQRFFDNVNNNR